MSFAEKIVVLRRSTGVHCGRTRQERWAARKAEEGREQQAAEAAETAEMRREDALSESVRRQFLEKAGGQASQRALERGAPAENYLFGWMTTKEWCRKLSGVRQQFHTRLKLFQRQAQDAKKEGNGLDEARRAFHLARVQRKRHPTKIEKPTSSPTFLILSKTKSPTTQLIVGECVNRLLKEWQALAPVKA